MKKINHSCTQDSCACHQEHSHEHSHDHCHEHIHEESHNHEGGCSSSGCGCGHDHAPKSKYANYEILLGIGFFALGIFFDKGLGNEVLAMLAQLVAYIILGYNIILTALKNIRKGDFFDENFLMSVATIGAMALKDFPEAVAVMLFFRIGEWFEGKAVAKSRKQIMDAVDMRPEVVHLSQGSQTKEIPADEAVIGDLIVIRPGDRIPLDGVIVEGNTRLDTSAITGEPVPVLVKEGDQILSGCINTSGLIKLRVEKELKDSMVSRILDSVENAAANKPKIEHFITKFSKVYTPIVLVIALLTAIIPSLITGNWSHYLYVALTFLVISCPCALVLSVPLSYFAGIGAGSKKNILFKSGAILEVLSHIKAVIVDKTGTITKGNFVVQKIQVASSVGVDNEIKIIHTEDTLLALAAACEQNSTHPIAQSIVDAAKAKNLTIETGISIEEIAGHGIKATTSVGEVLCGNKKLLDAHHIQIPDAFIQDGYTVVFMALNQSFFGAIYIFDTIKSDAKDTIGTLNRMHIQTVMLTGDDAQSANAVGKEVGIQKIFAKLLPDEKLHHLQKIRKETGSTLFVGDGINDAPVLAGADVGAAMGSGADAAIEAADVIYMTSNTSAIVDSIKIAKFTNIISKENVAFALGIKLLVMVLGLFGFASMWLAVFADTGVALLCVLNSVRILYKK